MMQADNSIEKFRIDKWLFAARFFKTRSLAAEAVERGRVSLNDQRVKPAKTVAGGGRVIIRIGSVQYVINADPRPRPSSFIAKQMKARNSAS